MKPRKERDLLNEKITAHDLSAMLNISEMAIRRLRVQGVLPLARNSRRQVIAGRYVLGETISRYVKHLRDSTADNPNEALYTTARARRMQALAQREELNLKLRAGELHSSDDVAFIMNSMLTYFKQRVMAIPSRNSRLCVGKSFREIYDLQMTEIELALRELSGYDKARFSAQNRKHLEDEGTNGETDEDEAAD